MAAKPHVIVVGAGIIGTSIAWHLARDGARVTVVAEDNGGVATPCSFSWINASWGNPEFYYRFRRRSMAEWKRLAGELPGLPLEWCGSLSWDLPPERLEAFIAEHGAWGYGIERVDGDAIRKREPHLANHPDHAVAVAEEGAVEPVAAARMMLADAKTRGATVIDAAVRGLLRTGERLSGVVTSAGVMEADHVVLASGAGTAPLTTSIGITLQIETPAGLIVHSRPHARLLNGLVMAPELHMRQTAEGRIIAGSDFGGAQPGEDQHATARALFAKVKAALADSQSLAMDFFTVGYRPTPKDGFPVIGDACDGLYIAVMHSGVTLAPLAGLLASSEILQGENDPMLTPFRPTRFL